MKAIFQPAISTNGRYRRADLPLLEQSTEAEDCPEADTRRDHRLGLNPAASKCGPLT
jgi:hypothetical protein